MSSQPKPSPEPFSSELWDILDTAGEAGMLSPETNFHYLKADEKTAIKTGFKTTFNAKTARYAVWKCGMKAERYPWQTTGALLITVGCGWLCVYFGWTVLAGLVAYAVTSED